MFFSFFVCISFSIIYTVDPGSDGIRVGIASNENGVGIQPSSRGFRQTPNIFGYYTDNSKNETVEKLVFGHGADIAKSRNISKTLENPFSYLLSRENYTFPDLHPSIASALSIRNIIPTITQKDQLVITVPSSSTPHYRSFLHEVGQIAGFSDVEIIDDSTALASIYIAEKLNKTNRKPVDVLFIDISKIRTEITQWRFLCTNNRINITLVDFFYTDKISGLVLDSLFKELLQTKLQKRIQELDDNVKKEQIEKLLGSDELMKIAIKSKELLSMNKSEEIELDIIQINELITITKSEIEELSKPLLEKLSSLLSHFSEVENIEICGGSSQFLLFDDIINKSFSNAKDISRRFASVDSTALGAAYYAALATRIISGYKLLITKNNIFDYYVIKGGKEVKILNGGQPYIRKFFNVMENSRFEFSLAAQLPESLYEKVDVEDAKKYKGEFTQVTIDGFEKFKPKDKMLLNVTLLPTRGYGEFVVTKVSGKNRKFQFDISERTPNPDLSVPGNAFSIMKQEVEHIKRGLTQAVPVKIELEMLISEAKDKLLHDATISIVVTKDEIEKNLGFIDECYANISLVKRKKLRSMHAFAALRLGQLILRADEFKERPFAAEALQDSIKHLESRIPFATSDDSIVQQVRDSIENAKEYLNKAISIDIHSTPVILCKDLRRKAETLLRKESDLFTGSRSSREL